jgi:intracellular sulfur oxidation DsrE/DsrF family protein
MTEYETKDSGARAEFSGGYVRDTNEGKPRFDLLLMAGVPYDQQPLYREAMLMARGAEKYDARNHELAYGYVQHTDIPEEEARFVESLLRHAVQLACGENDEDHASAVCFNARGVAMMRQRLEPTTQQEMKMTFTVLGEGVETYHNLTVTNTDTGEKTLLRGVKVSDADIDDVPCDRQGDDLELTFEEVEESQR